MCKIFFAMKNSFVEFLKFVNLLCDKLQIWMWTLFSISITRVNQTYYRWHVIIKIQKMLNIQL